MRHESACAARPAKPEGRVLRRATHHAGLGLRLSIVLRATRTLGGEVRARDLPGVGCVFTLDLPRALVAPAPRGVARPATCGT